MDMMVYKSWLGVIASGLTIVAYFPYLRSIIQGRVRPHVFTWIIWGTATLLAFGSTLQAGGGWGAWVIGLSAATSFVVAGFAYAKRADVSITSVDLLFFIAALSTVPIWILAQDPIWAVMLLTLIELLGFGPTFRKTWHAPHSESITFLVLLSFRNTLIIASLEHYTAVTVLFPAAAGLACIALVGIIMWRRPRTALL